MTHLEKGRIRFVQSRDHSVETGRRNENKSLRASGLGRESCHPAAAMARNGGSGLPVPPWHWWLTGALNQPPVEARPGTPPQPRWPWLAGPLTQMLGARGQEVMEGRAGVSDRSGQSSSPWAELPEQLRQAGASCPCCRTGQETGSWHSVLRVGQQLARA